MKILKISCLLLTILLFHTSLGLAQQNKPEAINLKIDDYMTSAIKHDYFSGSILIAKDGKPLYSKAYGMADIEHQVPNKVNTVFLIASITKQFTSLAIMQLVEQGKLSVNDPICKFLVNCPSSWESITVRNLLTQTSGIMNFTRLEDWDEKHSMQPYTQEEVVNLVIDLPLQFTPGEDFKYSNTNYTLLGLIIEKVSGIPYYDFLEKNIFNPLGMKNTGPINSTQIIPNRASGYYTKLSTFVNSPYENLETSFAAGGLQTTLADLLVWDQALYTNRLVSKKSLSEIFTPFIKNYGYGWNIFELGGLNAQGHGGSINGFSAYLLRLPDEKTTVIVLSNSDKANGTQVAYDLARIALNKEYKLPEIKFHEMLSHAYEKNGMESTISLSKEIKAREGEKYNEFDVLGHFGYDLMDLKKEKDAIILFNYLIEEFPEKSYGFDYLGEAYFRDKNYEMAMKYFQKALDIDSSNKYAIRGIKKVENAVKLSTGLPPKTTSSPKKSESPITSNLELDQFIEKKMAEAGMVGLSAAIIIDKKLAWTNGYGFADREEKTPFTPSTIMNIASISKTFTGVSIMKAVEDGILSLDEDINKYLPFMVTNPNFPDEKITLRHLATHTSGLSDRYPFYIDSLYFYGGTKPEPLGVFLKSYFGPGGKHYSKDNFKDSKPGTYREYSNIAAGLAGYIVELKTGKKLGKYAKKHIFKPLKMVNTGWALNDVNLKNHSEHYAKQDKYVRPIQMYELTTYPEGGVRTSVIELSRFFISLLNDGQYENIKILEKETAQEMLRFNYTETSKPENIKLNEVNSGIFWATKMNTSRIGHNGSDYGIRTIMLSDVNKEIAVILFSNTSLSDQDESKFWNIYDALQKYGMKMKKDL